jgi:hypothetical protein
MLVVGSSGYMFTSNKQYGKTERKKESKQEIEVAYSFLNKYIIFKTNLLQNYVHP